MADDGAAADVQDIGVPGLAAARAGGVMIYQHELDELEELGDSAALLGAQLADEPRMPELDDADLAGGFRARLRLTPRDYQAEAHSAWLAQGGRGTVILPTGAGKTVLALMAIERMRLRTLIVVPTIELLHQWRRAVVDLLQLPEQTVGVVGDGRRELRPITVVTYASAAMAGAPLGQAGLLICDEAHHLPAPAYAGIAERSGAPYRLAITATPERGDGGEDLLYQLIGPVVFRRTPEQLASEGHLAAFRERRIFVDLQPEEALRYTMLMGEWTWFLARRRGALSRGGDMFRELIQRSASDPAARGALRAYQQARMIALNASAKVDEAARLMAEHREEKVLIFSEYSALVDQVSARLGLPSITYRTAPAERRLTLERFRSGAYTKLVAGRVLNEGVDVPDASVAIVLSGSSTAREQIQRLGRVIRPKPREALLYELITRNTGELRAARRRRIR